MYKRSVPQKVQQKMQQKLSHNNNKSCCLFERAICINQVSGISLLIASKINLGCKFNFSLYSKAETERKIRFQ